jgi:hypothetical protein
MAIEYPDLIYVEPCSRLEVTATDSPSNSNSNSNSNSSSNSNSKSNISSNSNSNNNETRRFHTYVANRVERIRHVNSPKQWSYVPTHDNPADHATSSVPESEMNESK